MRRSGCRHPANARLDWYVNGSLSDTEEAGVGAHVDRCAVCSEQVDRLRTLVRALAESDDELPGEPTGAFRLRPRLWLVAAVVVPLLAAVTWVVAPPGQSAPDGTGGSPVIARVDLGDGPMRGRATSPPLVLPGNRGEVLVGLRVAVPGFRPDRARLTGPRGETRVDMPIADGPGAGGEMTLRFRAAILDEAGVYRVILRESTGGRELEYPFRVERER